MKAHFNNVNRIKIGDIEAIKRRDGKMFYIRRIMIRDQDYLFTWELVSNKEENLTISTTTGLYSTK
jgi:hypothetical protein